MKTITGRNNLIEEINELYTAGLCNPEYLEAKVLDSSKYYSWKLILRFISYLWQITQFRVWQLLQY